MQMLGKFWEKTKLIFYIFRPPPVQKTFLRHCLGFYFYLFTFREKEKIKWTKKVENILGFPESSVFLKFLKIELENSKH